MPPVSKAGRAPAPNQTLSALSAGLAEARARGAATRLYVVYAGHGNVRDGEGYLTAR